MIVNVAPFYFGTFGHVVRNFISHARVQKKEFFWGGMQLYRLAAAA